jgi:preprotein translocase subunit SecG
MNAMHTLIIIVQVLAALAIIGLVLIQHGKGADMGAAFGSGASGSLFGATGSSNFLSKSTAVAAAVFFVATLALAYLGTRPSASTGGVMDRMPAPSAPAPSAPASAPNSVPGAPAQSSNAPATAPAQQGNAPAAPGQSGQIPK